MKILKYSILPISFFLFIILVFFSSPYRQLRPYRIFGRNSDHSDQTESITVNGRQANLVTGTDAGESFYMDRIPVTISDYKKCIDSNICPAHHYRDQYDKYWDNPLYAILPVTFVTLNEARAYCSSIGGDLPTLAQWEAASGTGYGYEYAWGNEMPVISTANVDGYYQSLTPAGWLPEGASPFGILDMNGNMREWILDEDPTDPEGKGLKGGSFQDSFSSCKNDYTIYHLPTSAGFNRGFRCVYSLGQSSN